MGGGGEEEGELTPKGKEGTFWSDGHVLNLHGGLVQSSTFICQHLVSGIIRIYTLHVNFASQEKKNYTQTGSASQ